MCQCEDAPLGLGARTAPPSRPRHHIEASCPALVKTLLSSISSLRPCPVLPPKNWCDIMDMAGMATRGEVEYHPGITYFTLLREGRRTDRRERGGGEMLVTGGEERRGEERGSCWWSLVHQLASWVALLATKDGRAGSENCRHCTGARTKLIIIHYLLIRDFTSLFDLWQHSTYPGVMNSIQLPLQSPLIPPTSPLQLISNKYLN